MDEADPRAKLEPFQVLIGEWTIEMTHPMVEDMVDGVRSAQQRKAQRRGFDSRLRLATGRGRPGIP